MKTQPATEVPPIFDTCVYRKTVVTVQYEAWSEQNHADVRASLLNMRVSDLPSVDPDATIVIKSTERRITKHKIAL